MEIMFAQSGYIRLSNPVFHIHDLCPQADTIPVHVDAMTITFLLLVFVHLPTQSRLDGSQSR
jgi:hypothetical protein